AAREARLVSPALVTARSSHVHGARPRRPPFPPSASTPAVLAVPATVSRNGRVRASDPTIPAHWRRASRYTRSVTDR
ncbi:MAG: hypothetical protein ACTHMH_13350, partial [Curtobacterium sp.]